MFASPMVFNAANYELVNPKMNTIGDNLVNIGIKDSDKTCYIISLYPKWVFLMFTILFSLHDLFHFPFVEVIRSSC